MAELQESFGDRFYASAARLTLWRVSCATGDPQTHLATELSQTDVLSAQTLVLRRMPSLFERKDLLYYCPRPSRLSWHTIGERVSTGYSKSRQ